MPSMPGQVVPYQQGVPLTGRKPADAAGQSQLMGTQIFEDLSGGKMPSFKQKTLRQRFLTTVQQKTRNANRKMLARLKPENEEEDAPVREAASKAVASLRKHGQSALAQQLSNEYDPLEHYALLYNALCQVDDENLPDEEKEEVKTKLSSMLDDLWEQHGEQIRKGLQDAEALEHAVGAMAAARNVNPTSIAELRFLYGSKGKGRFDMPLTPLAMAKILQQKFGSENFSSAMGDLRSKMAADLRKDASYRDDPARSVSPVMWLSMSDAAAFNAVQSCHGISSGMNRDMAEKVGLLSGASPASITVAILVLVESGKPKLTAFITQVVDLRQVDQIKKGQAYDVILQWLKKLPLTLWPQDKLGQRMEILDEVSKMTHNAHYSAILPLMTRDPENAERQWRAELAQKNEKPENEKPQNEKPEQSEAGPAPSRQSR